MTLILIQNVSSHRPIKNIDCVFFRTKHVYALSSSFVSMNILIKFCIFVPLTYFQLEYICVMKYIFWQFALIRMSPPSQEGHSKPILKNGSQYMYCLEEYDQIHFKQEQICSQSIKSNFFSFDQKGILKMLHPKCYI